MFHAPIILWLTVTHNAPIDHSVFIGMNTAVRGGDCICTWRWGLSRPVRLILPASWTYYRAFGQWSALC